MIIYKKYYFDTAHFMPNHSKNHKYSKVHGHSYEITIFLNGKQNKKKGWVMDFEKIDIFMRPILKKIDHNLLNDLHGLENPTSENIAKWFWLHLKGKIKNLEKIEINRPRIGGCVYSGE